jgi:hypothetical protein
MPKGRSGHRRSSCTVCRHAERTRIDYLIASGGTGTLKPLGPRFGLSSQAIYNHAKKHVSAEFRAAVRIGPFESEEKLRQLCAENGASIVETGDRLLFLKRRCCPSNRRWSCVRRRSAPHCVLDTEPIRRCRERQQRSRLPCLTAKCCRCRDRHRRSCSGSSGSWSRDNRCWARSRYRRPAYPQGG